MTDLSKFSDEELRAIIAQARKPKERKLDAIDQARMDPTADMPWWEKGFAGMGKAGFDAVRGVGQLVGAYSREEMDEVKKQDKALMDTGWGMAGNVAGNVIPALALPGSTLPRAIASGAALGFSQPVGKDDSRLGNTLMGGGAAGIVPAGVAAYRGSRALLEPAMAPQKTAARILEQFSDDPQAMRLAAAGAKELVPGVKPTLAEVVQQPGISTLQRGMANQPGPMQGAITGRMAEQNAARVSFLDDLAGADGRLDFSKASRSTAAEELYAKAFAEVPGDTKWIKGEITKLMQRPAFVTALKDAQELALDSGIKVNPKNPENAAQLLHFTKMSLDDQIETAVRAGNGNKSKALIDTRDKLVSLMESKDFAPSYREARDTFKQMSKPINEMELAGKLRDKLTPSLNQVTNTTPTRLYADSMAGEVKRSAKDLERMSPEFQGKVGNLMQDLQRRASAESLGKATGSPTAQYLTTQNLMRQIAGPLGMPQGFADKMAGTLMGTAGVGSLAGLLAKPMEQRVQREVANLLLDPAQAAQAAALINQMPGPLKAKLLKGSPYAPALLASGMFSMGDRQ